MTPEQQARQRIDEQLRRCDWAVMDYKDLDLTAGPGVAVREFPLKGGFADYLLYADGLAVGVVEAKPEGHTLTGVETQSGRYLDGLPAGLPHACLPLPFAYESTGAVTQFSDHGLAVARGWLANKLADAVFPPKSNAANERLAQHLWNHFDQLLTFLTVPGLDATNWRAELAIRFGVILRKVWGGNRTWAGARAQAVLMSVWRTCWQQRRSALNFLSQLLRGGPVALALPP
jgi:hypothetical protein